MVCLGNICRSPLAEGILHHKALKLGLGWEVDSAGTSGYHNGEAPHVLSQKIASLNGVDIALQRSRQFRAEDIDNFDHIYVMDSSNYQDVKKICGSRWNDKKVSLLLNESYPGENRNVPDPWYGTEKDYHLVYDMLDKACQQVIAKYSSPIINCTI
ncbi:protein tyrosine phosphatase [Sediminibacterium ginsengisoli]|uniref:protein-tyrosine-phosphatase n=2 Tax=Sediminibacterium ginsengisoli TaxID=413434 RepID=A0A1T4NBJ0_9BACT|nr:protein tyrosine phosphatase [Sediminibacterium ginsengisoli]